MLTDLGQIFEALEDMGYCPECGEFADDCSCCDRFEHRTEGTEDEERIRVEIGGTISDDIS